jgi:hypothetical protein
VAGVAAKSGGAAIVAMNAHIKDDLILAVAPCLLRCLCLLVKAAGHRSISNG